MIVSILNMISVTCYMPQALKVAKIKQLLKKPALDLAVLVNYRAIASLLFISEILERVVLKHLACSWYR